MARVYVRDSRVRGGGYWRVQSKSNKARLDAAGRKSARRKELKHKKRTRKHHPAVPADMEGAIRLMAKRGVPAGGRPVPGRKGLLQYKQTSKLTLKHGGKSAVKGKAHKKVQRGMKRAA